MPARHHVKIGGARDVRHRCGSETISAAQGNDVAGDQVAPMSAL